jgi:hypothetical protein
MYTLAGAETPLIFSAKILKLLPPQLLEGSSTILFQNCLTGDIVLKKLCLERSKKPAKIISIFALLR